MTEETAPTETLAKSWLRELIDSVLPALIIVLVVNQFVAQATRVEGQSMEPNLHNNQRLIVEKLSYRFHGPARGDIIVLERANRSTEPLIKRIIGLPGETIAVHDGRVYINDEPLDEPYLGQDLATWGHMTARLVPEESVFVLGDNRQASNDSRAFGAVSYDDIIGRAWLRYWPFSEIGVIESAD